MTRDSVGDEFNPLTALSRSVRLKGKASLSVFWRVFWKVAVGTAALFLLAFFALHHDDLAGPLSKVALGAVVVLGYCLFYAFWVGLAAAAFAVAWRWCGVWIVVPLVGAALGGAGSVALAWAIVRRIDFGGAGLHGGGDIAAFLVLGVLAVSAASGVITGGVLVGIAALIVALTTGRRRQA